MILLYTSEIDVLSPDISSSLAVIQRTGYIDTGSLNRTVTIYGVDFGQYAAQYPTTFVAASGSIPLNATGFSLLLAYDMMSRRQISG